MLRVICDEDWILDCIESVHWGSAMKTQIIGLSSQYTIPPQVLDGAMRWEIQNSKFKIENSVERRP